MNIDIERYKIRKAYRILINDESDVAFNFVNRILKYPKDRHDVDKLFKNYRKATIDLTSKDSNVTMNGLTKEQIKYLDKLWSEQEYDLFYKKQEEFQTGSYSKTH